MTAGFGALSRSDIAVGGKAFDMQPSEESSEEESQESNDSLRTS